MKRVIKDVECNAAGKQLIKWIEENGLQILNGGELDRSDGDWTYIGHLGNTVIDYVITNEKSKREIEEFKIEDSIMSDHHPIVLSLKCEREMERMEKEQVKIGKEKFKWGPQQIEEYQNKILEGEMQELGGETTDMWEDIKNIINKSRVRQSVRYSQNSTDPG